MTDDGVILISGASEYARNANRWKNYGVTHAQYMAWFHAQDGCCLVCDADWSHDATGMSVDHDHVTGQIRGLLCSPCNAALGLLNDDPARCRAAALYLERQPLDHVAHPGGRRTQLPPAKATTPRCPACGCAVRVTLGGAFYRHRTKFQDPLAPYCSVSS